VLGSWLTIFAVKTSFFLAAACWRQRNEWQIWWKCSVTSQSQSAAMDGRRTARFEWGIAWTFACKMHGIEKSSEFKSAEHAHQSDENRNSATAPGVVLVVQTGIESTARHTFRQDKSSGPRGPCAISKVLDKRGRRHVLRWKLASYGLNPQNLPLILPGSLLFTPSPSSPQQHLTAFSNWKPCFCFR
jgi:hypothetical protein